MKTRTSLLASPSAAGDPPPAANDPLLLDERARLLHIGPPKTATTALQAAAAARRSELLAHGVRYPGTTRSHRSAVAAFLDRPIGWAGSQAGRAPGRHHWDELVAEVEADPTRRVLLGHEYAAGADDAAAARLVEAVGPRTHVVVTLRSYGTMLPSIWQEHCKAGNVEPFETWLERVLRRPRPAAVVRRFHVRHDQGTLVRRWAAVAGPAAVTVVVIDPADPAAVFSPFERMLGLPTGLLTGSDRATNRSLSVPEVELLRRLNGVVRDRAVPWPDYERIVVQGCATRLLGQRSPVPGEPRLRLPDWAAERADEEAHRHVEEIRAAGVRVVGDLDQLAAPAPRSTDPAEDHRAVTEVPLEIAVLAVEGAVSAALGRGADFDPHGAGRPPSERRVCDVRTTDLLGVVYRRAGRALRRRLTGRLPGRLDPSAAGPPHREPGGDITTA